MGWKVSFSGSLHKSDMLYKVFGWGCSSVDRASDRHAADTGSIPRCGKGFFSQSQLSGRLSYGVRTPPCAFACIYVCAHVKDPVVNIRVRWIMQTLRHPACTLVWVARLCRSWLSLGKATRISHGRNSIWTKQLLKVIKKKGVKKALRTTVI